MAAGGMVTDSRPLNGLPGSESEQSEQAALGVHGTSHVTPALDIPPGADYRHPVSASRDDYQPAPVAFPSDPTTTRAPVADAGDVGDWTAESAYLDD